MNCQKFKKLLGHELKKIRLECGKSRSQVFLDTNIQIGRIEEGKTGFSTTTYHMICDYYSLEYDFVFKQVEQLRTNGRPPKNCWGSDNVDSENG